MLCDAFAFLALHYSAFAPQLRTKPVYAVAAHGASQLCDPTPLLIVDIVYFFPDEPPFAGVSPLTNTFQFAVVKALSNHWLQVVL